MYKILSLFMFLFICSTFSFAQEDIQIGQMPLDFRRPTQGGFFDYSDPETVNITVQVWGFVKYPGQYIIPGYSSVNNLISLAGGPTDDAELEDLRLFRVNKDSSQSMIKFNYNDLLWEDELSGHINIPELLAGDILLVPGEPRFYFKDYFSLVTSVVGTLVSIAILFVTIYNK
jgi:polysaccharide biosynthesis/export protein